MTKKDLFKLIDNKTVTVKSLNQMPVDNQIAYFEEQVVIINKGLSKDVEQCSMIGTKKEDGTPRTVEFNNGQVFWLSTPVNEERLVTVKSREILIGSTHTNKTSVTEISETDKSITFATKTFLVTYNKAL